MQTFPGAEAIGVPIFSLEGQRSRSSGVKTSSRKWRILCRLIGYFRSALGGCIDVRWTDTSVGFYASALPSLGGADDVLLSHGPSVRPSVCSFLSAYPMLIPRHLWHASMDLLAVFSFQFFPVSVIVITLQCGVQFFSKQRQNTSHSREVSGRLISTHLHTLRASFF